MLKTGLQNLVRLALSVGYSIGQIVMIFDDTNPRKLRVFQASSGFPCKLRVSMQNPKFHRSQNMGSVLASLDT